MLARSKEKLVALLFDSDPSKAGCRLYEDAEQIWFCPAHSDQETIQQTLREIENAAHRGAHIVLSMSFESYTAFSSAAHLPEINKPQANPEIPATPSLQAVAFRQMRLLDPKTALSWLDERSTDVEIHLSTPIPAISEEQFHDNVADIRERIAAGQTYQVNLTYPYGSQLRAFVPPSSTDEIEHERALYAAFAQLVRTVNVPYAGLLLMPENSMLSFSPELFFELDGLQLRARPMKGTAPLGKTSEETEQLSLALSQDPKNRAENLMILDLLRNDVARLAQTEHVSVPEKFVVKPYGTVLQMTSTVQAKLSAQPPLPELLDALFPCGSITGAPKHETIRIIQEIEPYARGAYCGAIGYIERSDTNAEQLNMCMNVAIRTLETTAEPILEPYGIARWPLQCSVGAGITYDSEPAAEWQECELKAQFLSRHTSAFELIETMRLQRDRCQQWDVSLLSLREHIQRMRQSAHDLAIPWDEAAFFACLNNARALALPHQTASALRLRMALDIQGAFSAQVQPLEAVQTARFAIANHPFNSQNPLRAHKTSIRAVYNRALTQAKAEDLFDYVFTNEKGELTEGARSCLFVQLGGNWYTPPLGCGVLPSIARTLAFKNAEMNLQERVLYPEDLKHANHIMLGNALYGLLPAEEANPH